MKHETFFYLVILRDTPVPYHPITNREEATKFADSHAGSEFWCVRKGALGVYLDAYKRAPQEFQFYDEAAKKLFGAQ